MRVRHLYQSPTMAISVIECRPHAMGRGAIEAPGYHSLAFVRRGAYKFHRGNDEIIIDPLTAMLFATGDEYSVSHPLGCGDDCLEIRLDDELLREARPSLRRAENTASGSIRSRTLPISCGIQREFALMSTRAELGLVTNLEVEESTLAIIGAVGARESAEDSFETRRKPAGDSLRARKKVEDAKEILLYDLERNWSLCEIAGLVGASPFHLTRLVRKFTGSTLHKYVTRQRLAVALTRLLDGAENITELAFDLGFSSHSHLSAAFRKEYGQSPSSMRKRLRPSTERRNARSFRR